VFSQWLPLEGFEGHIFSGYHYRENDHFSQLRGFKGVVVVLVLDSLPLSQCDEIATV